MRRDVIARRIAKVCPTPLTPEQLDAAAAYVEAHPDAAPILSPFVRVEAEARICRGIPIS